MTLCMGQCIRLEPTLKQDGYFKRCAGAARFAFNWGLKEWNRQYQDWKCVNAEWERDKQGIKPKKPDWQKINNQFNAIKKAVYPWTQELTCWCTVFAFKDLGAAFANFFRCLKKGEKPMGYPRLKKKGRCREGFGIVGKDLKFQVDSIKIPKIGWVHMRRALRFPGRVVTGRVFKKANHWYISVQIEVDETKWSYPHKCKTQATCGIDLGCQAHVLSDGTKFKVPRSFRQLEKKLRHLNKEASRRYEERKRRVKEKFNELKKTHPHTDEDALMKITLSEIKSKNLQKTRAKIAKLHARIADIRKDWKHKLTTDLVKDFRVIGLETLNVKGMLKNKRTSKSVVDASFYEVRRQLMYKAELAGSKVILADRWFPSSKLCSVCGIKNDGLERESEWVCDTCGTKHDRDINAAKNLKQLAMDYVAE